MITFSPTNIDLLSLSIRNQRKPLILQIRYLNFEEKVKYGKIMDGCNFIAYRAGVDVFEISKIESGCMVCLKYFISKQKQTPPFPKLTEVYQINPLKTLTDMWQPTKHNLKFLIHPIVQLNKAQPIDFILSMYPMLERIIHDENLCCYICQLSGTTYVEIEKWKVEEYSITPEKAFSVEFMDFGQPKESYRIGDVKYVKNEDAKNFPFPSRIQRSNVVQPKYFTTENPFQPEKIVSCRRADSEINNLLNVSKSSSV